MNDSALAYSQWSTIRRHKHVALSAHQRTTFAVHVVGMRVSVDNVEAVVLVQRRVLEAAILRPWITDILSDDAVFTDCRVKVGVVTMVSVLSRRNGTTS